MEDLLREILAPSPPMASSSLPVDSLAASSLFQFPETSTLSPLVDTTDWDSEAGMQRLLDMLPNAQSANVCNSDSPYSLDFPSALDLDLNAGWDVDNVLPASSEIGVF